jgi:5-formyltetrahydrofolate cyclo-ligase
LTKDVFRRECKEKLKSVKGFQRRLYSRKIEERVLSVLNRERAKNILLYLPLSIEADLQPLIRKLRKSNRQLYVPFINGISFKMVKFRLPLKKSSFGVYESSFSKVRKDRIDAVIVPVIGIDQDFRRVGFGKGMYDRFYQTLRNQPLLIFVELKSCISAYRITQQHDIKANYYITFDKFLKIEDSRSYAIRDTDRTPNYRGYNLST